MPDPVYTSIEAFVGELCRAGLEHACVCPGARSTPLALVMATHGGLRAWSHIDERSGSFFALGIAKATRKPVAVVCTSGTAAANFLPAVIEAQYSHVPLLVLTADRPPELRDCGAGQTIDQIRLYGSNVKWFAEAGTPEAGARYFHSLARRAVAAATAIPPGPVHINFPFREPLMPSGERGNGALQAEASRGSVHEPERTPTRATLALLENLVGAARRGLVVCGPYDSNERFARAVSRFAARAGYPILADPLSQLRTGVHDTRMVVGCYDALLRQARFAERMRPDLIVRCGAMPTSKAFLQYVERLPECMQVVIDPLGFWRDPTLLAAEVVRADPTLLFEALADRMQSVDHDAQWCDGWMNADQCAADVISRSLNETIELFEGKVFAELAALIPEGATLYAGNSMPVRDLDGFWPVGSKRMRFLCNRGANGIDGFVSSGLGAAAAGDAPLVMVTGDLGFYHDLNGLMTVKRHGVRATIIVLNNNGGGIFGFLPQADCGAPFEEFFATPHGLDFRGAVEMYGATFVRVHDWAEFRNAVRSAPSADRTTVIEVPVDRNRNIELHRKIWAEVGSLLSDPANLPLPAAKRGWGEGSILNVETCGAGPTLVMLHGFTGSAADWRDHAAVLSRHFRVLAVDLPGHGKSDAPSDPSLYRIERCVEELAALLDRRGVERATWLGYSMGGRMALAFAIAHPDRVERLILESASPGIADPAERSTRIANDEALAVRIERDGIEAFVDEWMKQPLFASQARLGAARLAQVRAARLANNQVGLANSLRGAGSGAQEPLWERLHEITAPVLLIVGEEDTKFSAIAAAMRARLPDCRIVNIPRAGHNTHLENPDGFRRAVLEFLNQEGT